MKGARVTCIGVWADFLILAFLEVCAHGALRGATLWAIVPANVTWDAYPEIAVAGVLASALTATARCR